MTEKRGGPAVWVATCCGLGYFPIAPGTVGSIVGVALAAGMGHLPLSRLWQSLLGAMTVAAVFALGVWAGGKAEKFFGRVDPGSVVIDEVAGQMLALLRRPAASWKWLVAGFVLFRIFDIAKPFPAGRAEKLRGGWGIMLDDVVAALYSLAVLWLLELKFR